MRGTRWAANALRLLALAALAAAVLAACSPIQALTPKLTSEIPPTPTALPGADLGGRGGLNAEEGLALVVQVYGLLLDQYVETPDPAGLLRVAWDGLVAALPAGPARPEPPAFSGSDNRGDLLRFRTAYLAATAHIAGRELQARLAYAAIRAMTDSLSDCHTQFSDPQQVREQEERLLGLSRFGGVGIRIKRRAGESIVVWELLDGGSAGKAGIKPGDAILKVDGKDTAPLSLEQIAALIRGPEGSQVKLTVERADGKRVQDFSLKRVVLADPAFQSKWLAGNVAYLRLYRFSDSGARELLNAVREMEAKNPRGWIIDLRTNAGGDLPVVLSLLSKFLKSGPFGYQVDRTGYRSAFGPDGTYLPKQHPLVVLVSDSSASGAELFAAALQHYGAATVIGTRTAGCLGVGSRFQLSDGSAISVATRKLLGPAGQELNRVGLTPAEVIDVSRSDLAAGRDPQLQRALAVLGAPSR